jgi:SulP family sulfate permease
VEGLDSTAVFSFARLQQTASDADVSLVFSNAGSILAESLDQSERITFKDDIDQALEWCEDRLLAGETVDGEDHGHLLGDAAWQHLLPYMDRLELDENGVLADMGEDADCVYFIESGRIAVELPVGADRWQRVRSVGHGNLLGEFALYVDGGRSARLRAEMQSTVLRLTADAVDNLESTDPGSAIAFHRAVAHTMADRLMSTNDFVRALIR